MNSRGSKKGFAGSHQKSAPKMIQPKGYVWEPIAQDDFIFGSSKLEGEILQSLGNWGEFLPPPETQFRKIDSYNCTAEGSSNAIETILKRKFGGEWDFSQRAIGIANGTRPPGSSPKKVADTMRHKPCMIPEANLPFDDRIETVEQYYTPSPLVFPLTRIGKEFLDTYEVGYEWVGNTDKEMSEALKISPLCVSVYAWEEKDMLYYRPIDAQDVHWTMMYALDGKRYVFDSYPPFLKVLSEDFTFGQVMRYSIKKRLKKTYWWFEIFKRLTV